MSSNDMKEKLAKGAGVNTLGIFAKALNPLFFILITRIYGPEVFGVYLLGYTILEMSVYFTLAGYQDGVLLFVSRHIHDRKEQRITYSIMANALAVVLILTAVLLVLGYTAGPWFLDWKFARPGLTEAVMIMLPSLPFIAVPLLIIASTKSLMIMKYDAFIIGFLKPFVLLSLSLIISIFEKSITGLAISYLITNIVLTAVTLGVYSRHFSIKKLIFSFRKFSFKKELTSFSLPQNLNLTLNYFTSGISLLMLGMFNVSSTMIAFYGTAAEIIRNIRQVRLAFSTAFTPLIARLYKEKKIGELENNFATVSRWVVTAAIPIVLLLLSVKGYMLLLFHPSYTHNSDFMFILALAAFLNCAFGLAGNMVVMTGHSKWNLFNSAMAGSLSLFFNWLLISRFGLWGAAFATTCAGVSLSMLELTESYFLLGIKLSVRKIMKPYLAGLPAIAVFTFIHFSSVEPEYLKSAFSAVASIGVFAAAIYFLKLSQEDRDAFFPFLKKDKTG